jgi:hypothetical protein
MASIDFAFDVTRDIPDTLDGGDGRAAELHDKTAHFLFIAAKGAVPLLVRVMASSAQNRSTGPKRRLYIPAPGSASHSGPSGAGTVNRAKIMGRYVNSILQPGERVLYSTTIHGIIYLPGGLCLAAAVACFTASAVFPPLLIGVGVLGIIGVVLVFRAWFRRWTTEADVTTMRVIYKEGFISRQTFEMSLDKVESVDVTQSILGRIFDWGDVEVFGVGEGRKKIKMIAAPLEFRNHITTR